MKYFFSHLPESVWVDIAAQMDANMARETNNMGKARARKNKAVTDKKAVHFMGVNILMENSYGNDMGRLKKHFHFIKSTKCNNMIKYDKFHALKSAFYGSNVLLRGICDKFHEQSTSGWQM